MVIKKIYESVKDTSERITSIAPETRIITSSKMTSCIISILPQEVHQTFKGFGGALTESSGYVLSQLSFPVRQKIITSYYGTTNSNRYVFARTHMNSCDFSLENWSCVPQKDETLSSFSMERTDRYITPLVTEAAKLCGDSFKLMITPWSPPEWMKDNNDMNHGGKLLAIYKPLWAQYFIKFIQELKKRNLNVSYVSIQNEPAAVQTWDSCIWSAEEEGQFAVQDLGPALEKSGLGNIKILVWDHNRDLLKERFNSSMSIPGADKYIAGAAYHWYSGDQYDNVNDLSQQYKTKDFFFTEGSIEGGARNGAWFTGERYAHNIINDLNNGCNAWIDWNIVLDLNGGPNHVNNFCDAPVLVDTQTSNVYYQSSYYAIGHFSRFINPGSVRIGTRMDSWMTPATPDGRMGNYMECTSFINPDGTKILVVTNRTEADMIYELTIEGQTETKKIICPPRGIQTLIYE